MEEYKRIKFHITTDHQLIALLYVTSMENAEKCAEQIGFKCEIHEENEEEVGFKYSIQWKSEEAMEMANKMKSEGVLPEYYDWVFPSCSFHYQKINDNAVAPKKGHLLDSGYDIVAIGVKKYDENTKTYFLNTGLKIRPPYGYYFEMYPRSSISKTGFVLANSVGIIDQNYRGELIVALKQVADTPLPPLPWKVAQIIPKQFIHFSPVETNELDETVRGEGGFGSSGN